MSTINLRTIANGTLIDGIVAGGDLQGVFPNPTLTNSSPNTIFEYQSYGGANPHATILIGKYWYIFDASTAKGCKLNLLNFADISLSAIPAMTQVCLANDGSIYGIETATNPRIFKISTIDLTYSIVATCTGINVGPGPSIATDGTDLYVVGRQASATLNALVQKWTTLGVKLTENAFAGSNAHSINFFNSSVWVTGTGSDSSHKGWFAKLDSTTLAGSAVYLQSGSDYPSPTDDFISDGTYIYLFDEGSVQGASGKYYIVRVKISDNSISYYQTDYPIYAGALNGNNLYLGYVVGDGFRSIIGIFDTVATTHIDYPQLTAGPINELAFLNGSLYGTLWNDGRIFRFPQFKVSQSIGFLKASVSTFGARLLSMPAGSTLLINPSNGNFQEFTFFDTRIVDFVVTWPDSNTAIQLYIVYYNNSGAALTISQGTTIFGKGDIIIPTDRAAAFIYVFSAVDSFVWEFSRLNDLPNPSF